MIVREILVFLFIVTSYVTSTLLLFRFRESGYINPAIYSGIHISLAVFMFFYLTVVCVQLMLH